MEKNKLIMQNEKGESIEAKVLFTVEDAKTLKNYIVYTDNKKDNKGNIKTYVSLYENDEEEDKINLFPITTSEEFDFINKILSSLTEKDKKDE